MIAKCALDLLDWHRTVSCVAQRKIAAIRVSCGRPVHGDNTARDYGLRCVVQCVDVARYSPVSNIYYNSGFLHSMQLNTIT